VLPARITLHSDEWLTVHLREGPLARRVGRRIVLPINDAGRWVRGIEFPADAGLDIEKAVRPFHPRKPAAGDEGGVTYDERADAAFIYFSMKSPDAGSPETALKCCRSIAVEADLAFDSLGGLVWLRFSPREANSSAADFISLIDAPLERFVAR